MSSRMSEACDELATAWLCLGDQERQSVLDWIRICVAPSVEVDEFLSSLVEVSEAYKEQCDAD